MNDYFLSSCQKFAGWKRSNCNYVVVRRETNDPIGWIRLFDNGSPLGRWMFDPLLTPLSQTDLLDISGLIGAIKDAHNNELDKM